MGDSHTTLSEAQLDILKAQTEDVVKPDCMVDEFGRKAVTLVQVFWHLHPAILGQVASTRHGWLM